ncbi:MAG: DUF47 domain-containing protein [Chloroflexi bacterium]|nr:DUF47 domain-containing protein [Chloroflexota bacterium]
MFKLSLLPREGKFFLLFEQSASNAVKVSRQLQEMLYHWDNIEERIKAITELEHEGDTIAHEIISQLHRTFVTPFDREDIALLAHSLDDVTDFVHAAADAMFLYKVEAPTNRAKELADIIVETAVEVEKALSEMRRRIELYHILRHCVEINRLENQADRVYRSALAELFADSRDIPYIIKWREIYEYMETATDRCEDVANVLEGVALKYT